MSLTLMAMCNNQWIIYNEFTVQGEEMDQIYVTRCIEPGLSQSLEGSYMTDYGTLIM